MLKTRNMKVLSSMFILLLVVLALLNKNRIDYIYMGNILILIFKFSIERIRK